MKNLFVAAAIVLGTVAFSACESKPAEGTTGDTTTVETTVDTMAVPTDTATVDTMAAPADTTTK